MQILVVEIQKLPEISGSRTNIGTGFIKRFEPMDSQVFGCAGPLDLHQSVAVAV